ncbi:TPA: hypothetical protein DCG86_09430 [Candidatus Marinimicrobia bacterium]|nr:MAG: hypothetical protein XD77_0054 [Marinimicrobia bacterium 46_47]KUK91130.1 MAG: hypothetical protein XE04_1200 [Marinimicrobia bacterium 46_43]HAE88225.1 hypothetical protein [Candidatus Neomarinimicrobiota bacterium]HBY17820.1 hypothetical protein [Candidatus Neomarinimicrobiota bacterium]
MTPTNIPRFFWISLSFCMIVATLGLLGIAWQSTSISIEIANAKINLSKAISEVRQIKNELETEQERLMEEKRALNDLLNNLEKVSATSSETEELLKSYLSDKRTPWPTVLEKQRFNQLDHQLLNLEKTLNIK